MAVGRRTLSRSGGIGPDIGYPVGCQLDDGRIFTAYYYQMPDENKLGGTRYLAGTYFRFTQAPPGR